MMMWTSDHGDYILIASDDNKPGDPCLIIKNTKANVLAWMRAFANIVEETDFDATLPGEIGNVGLGES